MWHIYEKLIIHWFSLLYIRLQCGWGTSWHFGTPECNMRISSPPPHKWKQNPHRITSIFYMCEMIANKQDSSTMIIEWPPGPWNIKNICFVPWCRSIGYWQTSRLIGVIVVHNEISSETKHSPKTDKLYHEMFLLQNFGVKFILKCRSWIILYCIKWPLTSGYWFRAAGGYIYGLRVTEQSTLILESKYQNVWLQCNVEMHEQQNKRQII